MYMQICLANCNKVQERGLKKGIKTKDQVCEKTINDFHQRTGIDLLKRDNLLFDIRAT